MQNEHVERQARRRPPRMYATLMRPISRDIAAWARSIAAKFRRATPRQSFPQRRFLRTALPRFGDRIVERLRSVVHRVAPRIELHLRCESQTKFSLRRPTIHPTSTGPAPRTDSALRSSISALAGPDPMRQVDGYPLEAPQGSTERTPRAPRPLAGGRARLARSADTGPSVSDVVNRRYERLERRIDLLSFRQLVLRKTRVENRALVRTTRVVKREHELSGTTGRQPRDRGPGPVHDAAAPGSLPRWASTAMAPDSVSSAPPIDIRSLTNQVMRRIDRRFLSWRERTGRV